jgi:hypothetical protein
MAEPKDTTSFFRKVVRFVANPATEWTELDAPTDEHRENEYAKGELKAMIERKRRNDFVRKRELDMLRKVRREGLTGEQLAALGGSSRMDDSEPRVDSVARQDSGVKAKIDEIEQQMVGDTYATTVRRGPEFYAARTAPVTLDGPAGPATAPMTVQGGGGHVHHFVANPPPVRGRGPTANADPGAPVAVVSAGAMALAPLDADGASPALTEAFAAASPRSRTTRTSTRPSSPSRMPTSTNANIR